MTQTLSLRLNKVQKIYTEAGPKVLFNKAVSLTWRTLLSSRVKQCLFTKNLVLKKYGGELINQQVERFLVAGLFRSPKEITTDLMFTSRESSNILVDDAESILQGEFKIYGGLSVRQIVDSMFWRRDPLTQFIWPKGISPAKVIKKKPIGTDIKNIWEIARFQFLSALAQAYILTRDERYAHFAIDKVNSWIDENVFLHGPHWTCAMETAIRLTNWAIYLPWLDVLKFSSPDFVTKLAKSLLEHLIFIRENLEVNLPHSNNHYLANLAALLLGPLIFPSVPWAADNAEFAKKELEKEIQIQFHKSGVNFEGSLSYHRLSSEICLMALALMRRAGYNLSSPVCERLGQAAMFTKYYTECSDEIPLIGDNDSGVFVKFFPGQESNRHNYLGFLFDCILQEEAKPRDLNEYLCSIHLKNADQPDGQGNDKNQGCSAELKVKDFDGLVIARYKSEALFYNTLQSSEGHSHNDKLAIYPVIGGKLLFLDRGSFSYTGYIAKRHEDRMTASHNGPALNGWEQSRIWKNDPFYIGGEAKCGRVIDTRSDYVIITGYHLGYSRYSPGLKVFREVEWDVRKRTMLIADWAEGKLPTHPFQFTWCFLINPAWTASLQDGHLILNSARQTVRFEDTKDIGFTLTQRLYCPTYQVESPCQALMASCRAGVGEKITFTLYY